MEQVAILFERRATARGVDDDRVQPESVERVDVAAGQVARCLAIARVHLQRAATALFRWTEHHAPIRRQNAHGGGVCIAEQLRHDAAFDEPDAVPNWTASRAHLWRCPATDPTLRRREHRFHFAQPRRQYPQRARLAQEALQAGALVEP